MNFYEHQDQARRKTGRLVVLFVIAVILILAAINLATFAILRLVSPHLSYVKDAAPVFREDERYPGTVIAVTHDRYFLDNVAGWILELDRGHGIPWEGNYSSWLEQKEQRLEIEAKQEAARIKAMKQELEWVRANPKARQAKSKARLARFEELASAEYQARGRYR